MSSPLETRPYPYTIVENVLPPSLLADVRRHWPDRSEFVPEVPGNYICVLREMKEEGTERRQFWRDFTEHAAPILARACIGRFAEWVIARYGLDFRYIGVGYLGVMQADPNYPGIPCHAHHWHDPLWIATALLYIDDDAGGQQGTTVHDFAIPNDQDPLDYASRFAARRLHKGMNWQDQSDVPEVRTSDYKANHMTVFLDSPISYHSVKPVGHNAHGRRRVLRLHLGAAWAASDSVYGLPIETIRNKRNGPTDETEVLSWMRRDISQVWNTSQSLSLRRRKKWARRLTVNFGP